MRKISSVIMVIALTLAACGGGGSSAPASTNTTTTPKESISISGPYFTPNPATIGQTAYFYFYVDSVSDPKQIKYLNMTKSDGTSVQVPMSTPTGWTAPGWLYIYSTVAAPAEQRTVTIWVTMSDGVESQKLSVTYTVQ